MLCHIYAILPAKLQKIIDICKHFTTYSVYFAQSYSTYSYFIRCISTIKDNFYKKMFFMFMSNLKDHVGKFSPIKKSAREGRFFLSPLWGMWG